MMQIYHNPRCRKSRETLKLIEEADADIEIIDYLSSPPSDAELSEVIQKLGISPKDLIRKGDAIFKERFKGKTYEDQEWIKIMVENPKLIERPIVIRGDKAIIGRPPENVLSLL